MKFPPLVLAGLLLIFGTGQMVFSQNDAPPDWLPEARWSYYGGYEFPGAKGSVRRERAEDREIVNLFYDFSDGGAYVAAKGAVDLPAETADFRFETKADRPHKLVVRLVDSTKQTHQWDVRYDQVGTWQPFLVDLTIPARKHFGGPNDGVIHFPVAEVMLCVAKSDLGSASEPGEVWFSNVKNP